MSRDLAGWGGWLRRVTVGGFICMRAAGAGAADDPFTIAVEPSGWSSPTGASFTVRYAIPADHYLYASSLLVTAAPPARLVLRSSAEPVLYADPLLGETTWVHTQSFSQVWSVDPPVPPRLTVSLEYQGCGQGVCFLPQTRRLTVSEQGVRPEEAHDGESAPPGPEDWLAGWRLAGTGSGFLRAREFLAFLDDAAGTGAPADAGLSWRAFAADPVAFVRAHGLIWTLLLVLLGGVLLNFTPCVLPMIPVNLGIIGVGAQGSSRRRGMLLGAAYGAGIALVYGILGVVVVLTGAMFGSLQSSPWFNAGMAVLFLALGLALFDLLVLDLARFQRGGSGRGSLGAAIVAGGLSALLAGACVAPVVAAVLILSGSMYARGVTAALFLPFLLGVGMALPWPLAGAGLSWLPKPGRWMVWVRHGFGVLVLVMAAYYGRLAWNGFRPDAPPAAGSIASGDRDAWREALAGAQSRGQPVFVDFWATWCKNCTAMEHSTFRDPAVRARLSGYTVVKVQAERPDTEPARGMLRALGVSGLPTYLILRRD